MSRVQRSFRQRRYKIRSAILWQMSTGNHVAWSHPFNNINRERKSGGRAEDNVILLLHPSARRKQVIQPFARSIICLTCYFLPISPPRCSGSVFFFFFLLIHRRPKSNLVTPITWRDTPPPSPPAPQGFVESFSLYAFEHLHSKPPPIPSPHPHVCLEWTKSFPIICAQPQSLITPPVVWLFCLSTNLSTRRRRFRSSCLR